MHEKVTERENNFRNYNSITYIVTAGIWQELLLTRILPGFISLVAGLAGTVMTGIFFYLLRKVRNKTNRET